jgi:hypothetical protein
MPVTEQQAAFMAKLKAEWSAEHEGPGSLLNPTYVFRGVGEGNERDDADELLPTYNSWLEHRHGWPIDDDGNCVASYPCCDEHGGYPPEPAEECPMCQTIVKWFEEDQAA